MGEELTQVVTLNGVDLRGTTYNQIFRNSQEQLPVLPAGYVTDESGTGLVHCAPAHGIEDFAAYKEQLAHTANFGIICPVDEDGLYRSDDTGLISQKLMKRLQGKEVLSSGGKEVIDIMKEGGLLLAEMKIRHKYPYDWKSKKPVIVRTTNQYFANLERIKDQAVQALRKVKFVPEQGK